MAMLRQDGFRVKLHTEQRQVLMRQRHQRAIFGICQRTKWRATQRANNQRMVAHHRKILRDALKKRMAVVRHNRGFPVHRHGSLPHSSPEVRSERLMPQTYP